MLENTLKIILIMILAGIIGWDRNNMADRPVSGHILVGIGSTIIMIVSVMIYKTFPGADADLDGLPQVVSGIGFLGAGTIMVRGVNSKRPDYCCQPLDHGSNRSGCWSRPLLYCRYRYSNYVYLLVFSPILKSVKKNTKQELLCRFDNWDGLL